uniref:Uncharacterized protein n=1 Tax=Thermofilum adornatum TaxID=1365176 RepID=A0A7C1GQI3_9CREN
MKRQLLVSYLITLLILVQVFGQPVVGVKKMVVREMDVLPGCTYNTTATVTLVFDSDTVLNFTDYVAYGSEGDASSTVDIFGSRLVDGFRATSFRNLNVTKGYTLKYSVPVRNLFNISINILADGKEVTLNCSSGYCVGVALKARSINYSLTILPLDPMFSNLQLPVSVSWSVDPTYLYPVAFSDSPQSMRESGSEVSFQWSSVMNGSYHLSVVFEVRGENPWGEVFVPSPIITITLDPRVQSMLISKYKEYTKKFLGSSLGNLSAFQENATQLRDLLYNLSKSFREQARLLGEAGSQAESAASIMLTASSQLKVLAQMTQEMRNNVAGQLGNVSTLINRTRAVLERASKNVTVTEEQLQVILQTLNLTNSNVTLTEIKQMIDSSLSSIGEVETLLEKYGSTIRDLDRLIDQSTAAAENMATAANKLILMANMLREASYNLNQLADGLARAADLLDSMIAKMSKIETAEYFPEGFKSFNETFYKQIVVSETPGVSVRTDFMGEAYYFALPSIKIKRSEPDVSNVTLETPQKRIASLWPVALIAVVLGVAFFIGRKGQQTSSIDEEKLARLYALRDKISRIMGGSNV